MTRETPQGRAPTGAAESRPARPLAEAALRADQAAPSGLLGLVFPRGISKRQSMWLRLGEYGLAVALTILIMVVWLRLYENPLRVPLKYHGDIFYSAMQAKAIMDNGWFLTNPSLGAPYGTMLHDFPLPDNLHFLTQKVIGWFVPNAFANCNVFFFLGFALSAITSLMVLRHFKVAYLPALLATLLFVFLPYHVYRYNHLLLSCYYMVPLGVMLALWVYLDDQLLFVPRPGRKLRALRPFRRKPLAALLIAALLASTGVYYAFFACFFMGLAGLAQALWRRSLYPAVTAAVLVGAIGLGCFLNVLPNMLYVAKQGKNLQVAQRGAFESELYGLKVMWMLLPIQGHPIKAFDRLYWRYYYETGGNEYCWSTLSAVGVCGFFGLLIAPMLRRKSQEMELRGGLSTMLVGGVLLSTMGGLGTFVAYVFSPQIRCYNRISIYLGFICLLAVAMGLSYIKRRFARGPRAECLFVAAVIGLGVLGILDQCTRNLISPHKQNRADYDSDASLMKHIEASVPRAAMIFQLPYYPFPEQPPLNQMHDYDLFRGYLHSKSLRWSYGAVRGRPGDAWLKSVCAKPLAEMVQTISEAGFSGIYIDRNGYVGTDPNEAAKQREALTKMEDDLANMLGCAPIVSGNQRLAFFNMVDYNRRRAETQPARQSVTGTLKADAPETSGATR